ncbi:hypothetical protein AB0D14_11295 [Streptomyces sp. NPDC048484]|uniref:hypothetical protein n=1 Tax=Streptomyces sp. NPDC048484 TaxID=3155146 RepID=UPI00344187EE
MKFGAAEIEVTDFGDVTAGERVLEFRYRGGAPAQSAFAAVVVPDGGGWAQARLSIDPQVGDVPVALVGKLIETARAFIEEG